MLPEKEDNQSFAGSEKKKDGDNGAVRSWRSCDSRPCNVCQRCRILRVSVSQKNNNNVVDCYVPKKRNFVRSIAVHEKLNFVRSIVVHEKLNL